MVAQGLHRFVHRRGDDNLHVWCDVVWCGVVWCGVVWCGVVWCGVVWCGVVWCGVVWCGVVWCGVVWCGVVWCDVVCCGVVWSGVEWSGVEWCGVVWCGVVWCGEGAVTRRQWPGCLPMGIGKREGWVSKCSVLSACVLMHSRTSADSQLAGIALSKPVPSHAGSSRPTAPCVPRSSVLSVWYRTAWCCALHCTVCALLHCTCGQRAVGCGTLATHCQTAWRLWAVELLQHIASLHGGSGQWNACSARPQCLGAVGGATPAIYCLTARGQWAVALLLNTASLPWGSGQ